MKKLITLWLILGMIPVLSINALASPLRWTGNYFSRINSGPYSNQGSSLQLGTAFGDRIHGTAVINGIQNLAGDDNLQESLSRLSLGEAYLELAASGTVPARVRLGTLDINYSPYLASFQPWQGLGLAGWAPGGGGLKVGAFYVWSENLPVWGSQFALNPAENMELSFNLVGDGRDLTSSVEGLAQPYEPLVLTWAVARNQQGAGPVKLDAVYNVAANLVLRSGFRSFPTLDQFNPTYRDIRTDDFGDPINPVDLYHGQIGYSGGVTVKFAGLDTGFDMSHYNQRSGAADDPDQFPAGPNRLYQFSVMKTYRLNWGSFRGGYIRSYHDAPDFDKVGNDLQGGFRFNSSLLQGLEIGAELRSEQWAGDSTPRNRAVGVVAYERSGLFSKWVYNFYTGQTSVETDFQVRF